MGKDVLPMYWKMQRMLRFHEYIATIEFFQMGRYFETLCSVYGHIQNRRRRFLYDAVYIYYIMFHVQFEVGLPISVLRKG